jgi:hypothetical protein
MKGLIILTLIGAGCIFLIGLMHSTPHRYEGRVVSVSII